VGHPWCFPWFSGLLPTFPLLVLEPNEVDGLIGATSDNGGLVASLRVEGARFATPGWLTGAGIRSFSEVAFEDDLVSAFDAFCSVIQRICRQLLEPFFLPTRDEQVHLQYWCLQVLI
jgi:hypothetical protein